MQDFLYGRVKSQEATPEPYMLYRKDQNTQNEVSDRIRDFEYFKSMYPARVKKWQQFVEEVCDEMEYEGSPIYDEFPDRVMMERMLQKIGERAEAADVTATASEIHPKSEEKEETESCETAPASEQVSVTATDYQEKESPRVSYGPICGECRQENGGYQTWEMEETRIQEVRGGRDPWGPPPPPRPWGPPPPPNPWGPPPPPNPWGPPPPPRPWGPPPPPRPWGPPPPPPRPWGPPPPPHHGGNGLFGDILNILLFNELQGRRCRSRNCR